MFSSLNIFYNFFLKGSYQVALPGLELWYQPVSVSLEIKGMHHQAWLIPFFFFLFVKDFAFYFTEKKKSDKKIILTFKFTYLPTFVHSPLSSQSFSYSCLSKHAG